MRKIQDELLENRRKFVGVEERRDRGQGCQSILQVDSLFATEERDLVQPVVLAEELDCSELMTELNGGKTVAVQLFEAPRSPSLSLKLFLSIVGEVRSRL